MKRTTENKLESKYTQAKINYQQKCAEYIQHLKEICLNPTPDLLNIIENTYGREAMEEDLMDVEDILQSGLCLIQKCEDNLKRSINNPTRIQNLEALQNDWQYVVHSIDNEMAISARFVGGFSTEENAQIYQLKQAALLAFIQYEKTLTSISEEEADTDSADTSSSDSESNNSPFLR